MYRLTALFILIVVQVSSSYAQNVFNSEQSLGLNYYPGYLIAHRADAQNLQAHIQGIELYFDVDHSNDPKYRSYNSIHTGIGAMFMDLGQPNLTGRVFALLPYFDLGLTSPDKKGQLRFRMGSGLGYLTQKFDFYKNRRNLAIGSHVNGAMQLFAYYEYKAKSLRLKAGIGITHFSNASFRVPNLGVNMPSMTMGAQYLLHERSQNRPTLQSNQGVFYEFTGVYGFKERTISKPNEFHMISLQAKRIHPATDVRNWRYGIDVSRDKTYAYIEVEQNDLSQVSLVESLEVGISGGVEWKLGKTAFLMDLGFYVVQPNNSKYIPYQRLGFKQDLTKNLFLQGTLKTSFGIADYMEWGLGYRLNQNRNE